jgi:hypothetical protein
MVFAVGLKCGLAVTSFGHYLHVRLDVQGRRQTHPNHEVIVNH